MRYQVPLDTADVIITPDSNLDQSLLFKGILGIKTIGCFSYVIEDIEQYVIFELDIVRIASVENGNT